MDLSPMMTVLEIDSAALMARVQPGVRWADLAAKLEPFGLAPTTTPTSRFSTVAGWIATGGMGLESYAYGNIRESVLGARVARPDGTIQVLDSQSESFEDIFGTEGQFGIMTEVTLRVRLQPQHSGAWLMTFDDPVRAIEWVNRLPDAGIQPSHVAYFDREYMKKENILFSEQKEGPENIVPEEDTVLLHFDNTEKEQRFLSSLNGNTDRAESNVLAARYLWSDRYFPLKAQRISPGMLGTEVVIPGSMVPGYIRKTRRLAQHFHIHPTIETIVCRDGKRIFHLVIISFNCDYSRKLHYALCLLFIQLLVRQALRCKGHPYGVGIWNTPFVGSRYTKDRLAGLVEKKRAVDPDRILNPHKFFKISGRFWGIPAFFMRPMAFRAILGLSRLFSPVLGSIAGLLGPERSRSWDVPTKDDKGGKALLFQSAQRCTSCGSCISVCPAYHITKDELVTGRAKLRMAEAMIKEEDLEQEEAHSPFRCLHCGLCEEVCQTGLPLRECYLALEEWIAARYGQPMGPVQEFVEKLDKNRDYIEDVFGLDLPEWNPGDKFVRIPPAERFREGERP